MSYSLSQCDLLSGKITLYFEIEYVTLVICYCAEVRSCLAATPWMEEV